MADCRTGVGLTCADIEASVNNVGNIEKASESAINPSSQALQAFNDEVFGHDMATILKSQFPSLKSTAGGFNVLGMNFFCADVMTQQI